MKVINVFEKIAIFGGSTACGSHYDLKKKGSSCYIKESDTNYANIDNHKGCSNIRSVYGNYMSCGAFNYSVPTTITVAISCESMPPCTGDINLN